MNELERYGIEWASPTKPIAIAMPDGYWTPWHLAQERIAELEDKLKIVTNILDSGYDIEVGSNTHHKLKGHKDDD